MPPCSVWLLNGQSIGIYLDFVVAVPHGRQGIVRQLFGTGGRAEHFSFLPLNTAPQRDHEPTSTNSAKNFPTASAQNLPP